MTPFSSLLTVYFLWGLVIHISASSSSAFLWCLAIYFGWSSSSNDPFLSCHIYCNVQRLWVRSSILSTSPYFLSPVYLHHSRRHRSHCRHHQYDTVGTNPFVVVDLYWRSTNLLMCVEESHRAICSFHIIISNKLEFVLLYQSDQETRVFHIFCLLTLIVDPNFTATEFHWWLQKGEF